VLHGDTLDASFERAQALAAERGLTWVHPYDDALVIAGQGTAALEMLEDFPEIDTLVVPLGGGGLVSGMAVAAHALRPEMTIMAAEAALYPPFDNALKNRARPVGGPTLAEGIAVKSVGELTLPLVREHVAEVILVDESHLERAVNAFLTLQKVIAEGAGAAGLAAMLAAPELFRGRKVGLILSGGNIDPRILASVMLRELERESRIVSFRLSLDDRPGVLGRIATRLGALGANILEVDHRRQFLDVPAKGARLDVTVEARGAAHADAILAALADEGFDPQRIAAGAALE
jgi:threonine dehydratase